MHRPTDVTLLVPAYNAEPFIDETLESIRAQHHRDFRVLVSVDAGSDATAARCRAFADDDRFEVIEQPTRLGWLGNTNALIARVTTPFFAITPHDDILHPEYLLAVYDVMRTDASVSCAYSDIEGFGSESPGVAQPDVRGDPLERVIDVILHHYPCVAYRGLVRRRGPDDRPFVPDGIPGNFFADTAWLIPLALRGELRRVPRPLYRKRYDERSAHRSWLTTSRRTQVRRHAAMIARCAMLALDELPAEQHDEVLAAALLRSAGLADLDGWGIPETALECALGVTDCVRALGDAWHPVDPWQAAERSRVDALRRTASTFPPRRAARHGTLVTSALAGVGRVLHRLTG